MLVILETAALCYYCSLFVFLILRTFFFRSLASKMSIQGEFAGDANAQQSSRGYGVISYYPVMQSSLIASN